MPLLCKRVLSMVYCGIEQFKAFFRADQKACVVDKHARLSKRALLRGAARNNPGRDLQQLTFDSNMPSAESSGFEPLCLTTVRMFVSFLERLPSCHPLDSG